MTAQKKSSKSRGRRRPRQRRPDSAKRFDSLKNRLQKGPFRGHELVVTPRSSTKMSEVLWSFVEPYREFANTEEALRRLLTLAVLAWDAALLPEEERPRMIGEVFQALPLDEELRTGLRGIVDELIERKERCFSQYKRPIVDFELQDRGRDYHLIVVSFLEDTPSG